MRRVGQNEQNEGVVSVVEEGAGVNGHTFSFGYVGAEASVQVSANGHNIDEALANMVGAMRLTFDVLDMRGSLDG